MNGMIAEQIRPSSSGHASLAPGSAGCILPGHAVRPPVVRGSRGTSQARLSCVGREDLRHLPVCSVDPPGCRDIDDALHIRYSLSHSISCPVSQQHLQRPTPREASACMCALSACGATCPVDHEQAVKVANRA